jgi:hypothetical protein
MKLGPILVALVAFALVPAASHAQTAEAPSLKGIFVYDAGASDNVNAAINAAISGMNFALRPIARGRLKKTNQPYQRVVIDYTPAQVSIVMNNRAPIVTPANGTPVNWTRPEDGEKLTVSTEWENAGIEQTFLAEDGKRVNSYSISPDGRVMSVRVTITSPRLSRPLTYTLRYRRTA